MKSWDEIMGRLIELEKFEIPYPNVMLLENKDGTYSKSVCPEQPRAFFSFELAKYYTTLYIYFSSSGHRFWQKGMIFSVSADPTKGKEKGNNCKSLKGAAEKLLNFWENYIKKEKYHETYKKFQKWEAAVLELPATRKDWGVKL